MLPAKPRTDEDHELRVNYVTSLLRECGSFWGMKKSDRRERAADPAKRRFREIPQELTLRQEIRLAEARAGEEADRLVSRLRMKLHR
jgi:hypothetical protein